MLPSNTFPRGYILNSCNKVCTAMDDNERQVASAINEVMKLDSADQEALLDVVLDYFCEDSMNNQHESGSDTDCSDEVGFPLLQVGQPPSWR